ncbi:MAG TPA: hypothetical protein IAC49_08515 [Candidatus Ventricola intestinavium]|nr:hypothetical protein [Candidatus Ventricola intestinavium]
MWMQGYDIDAALPFIVRAMRRAGIRGKDEELAAFVQRAVQADMRYMSDTGVLDEQGLMGEGVYDDDDAFEALLDVLAAGETDEDQINRTAQMLDAYMQAQQDFLDQSGLME